MVAVFMDGIDSIPCRTTVDIFYQDDFEEKDEKNKGFLTEWMF